jgi:hypothetical protein
VLFRHIRRLTCAIAPIVVIAAVSSASNSAASAAPAKFAAAAQSSQSVANPAALADPGRTLPAGWKTSPDRAVTVAGDATGLHVLLADASDGYAWNTVATLSVSGTDTTQWIGQACLTGNGAEAVVVYAPRQITNAPDALGYGALAATVNLSTGKVSQFGAGVSIAYFNPGCGAGQDAVLTQGGTGASALPGPAGTRLMMLDTATGKITSQVSLPVQLTSAVPYNGGFAAVEGNAVVGVSSRGALRTLARVSGSAFQLVPDSHGGLGFLVASGKQTQVRRVAGTTDQLIGTAPLGKVELTQVGGQVFATGLQASRLGTMPAGWKPLNVLAGAQVSSTGMLAITSSSTGLYAPGKSPLAAVPDLSQPVKIAAQVPATAKAVAFTVPAAAPGTPGSVSPAALPPMPGAPAPAAGGGRTGAVTAPPVAAGQPAQQQPTRTAMTPAVSPPPSTNPATTTYDPDRSCSVPRNDPTIQAYQPSQAQVEWAVDQAVQDKLTANQPADLYSSQLPAYSPQGLFPPPGLDGGGTVPPQVLLGILSQESNEDQASNHDIIGQTGNFLPGYNWYGNWNNNTTPPSETNTVNWANTDCGYGIAQVTTGMCLSGYSGCTNPLSYTDQLAIAIDYEANIAAGLQLLEQKWNQLYSEPTKILANGGNPAYIQNWWFAVWAYNSGLEPNAANGNTTGCSPSPSCTDASGNGAGGNWGLGWVDNPANKLYPPDRPMFLQGVSGTTYNYNWDEAHPAGWSYEEKVIGFGTFGLVSYNYVTSSWGQSYAVATYPSGATPSSAEPSVSAFCTSSDNCVAANAGTSTACSLSNSHCWWHNPVSWTTCANDCGTGVSTYSAGAAAPAYPGVPSGYAPSCSNSPLPSNAVIVGAAISQVQAPLGCGAMWNDNGGAMTWNFAADTATSPVTYPSKIDFHQQGTVGYGGYYWFTHTLPSASANPAGPQPAQSNTADLQVTGTWKPPSTVTGWTRIMAAIPAEGAWDPQANYQINLGNGNTEYRVMNQAYQTDSWISLGFFDLSSGASVSLSNITYQGKGYDIAWSAMAFIPAAAPTADYVAMGDSYSAGEGLGPYQPNSDYTYGGMMNDCHRSATQGFPDLVTLPGQSSPIATQAANLASDDQFSYIACSDGQTPAITPNAIDTSTNGALSQWLTWDTNGNTEWTSSTEFNGGPDIFNALTQTTTFPTSNELPQADQGWLSPTTTLVTISQGGNDARFGSVVAGCDETDTTVSFDGNGCSYTNYYLTNNDTKKVDPDPLYEFEPWVLTGCPPGTTSNCPESSITWHLQKVYAAVAAAAPNAEIIVMEYPELFPGGGNPSGPCSPDAAISIPPADVAMLNGFGAELNTAITNAVKAEQALGIDINYVDPDTAFQTHEVCAAAPYINGVVNEESSNSGASLPGNDSYHPMPAGAQLFATLVNECLAGTLPSSQGSC